MGTAFISLAIIIFCKMFTGSNTEACASRRYDHDSVVCVCNATYCDDLPVNPEELLQSNSFLHFVTSRDGKRLEYTLQTFRSVERESDQEVGLLEVDLSQHYQKILGWGGAMTDASGFNIASLSRPVQQRLVRQYFGPEGAEYTLLRIPLGGCDFSLRNYDLNFTVNDTTAPQLELAEEDHKYKIEFARQARMVSERDIKMYAAAWSAPSWMKETLGRKFATRLQDRYYDTYALYLVSWLDAYRNHGLDMWGLSPQNEPTSDEYMIYYYNSMCWTTAEMRRFISKHLGPIFHRSGYSHVQVMTNDDQRYTLPDYAFDYFEDPEVSPYVSGAAVHFYFDFLPNAPVKILDEAHERFPDKFILYSEACFVGNIPRGSNLSAVEFGNWNRGEIYAHDIIDNMNHWVVGWTDWNMVLDLKGGPNWAGNFADAAIIVNATADEFYKQPMFYAIAHFSKFVPPDSVRIHLKGDAKRILHVAFLRPDGVVVVVLLNREDEGTEAVISAGAQGTMHINLPAHSIHTLMYRALKEPQVAEDRRSAASNKFRLALSLVPLLLSCVVLF